MLRKYKEKDLMILLNIEVPRMHVWVGVKTVSTDIGHLIWFPHFDAKIKGNGWLI